MPDPETLLRAAGVVKVVEQTWRLDTQGPTGNSSARIGERPRIEAGAVQQAREGEAWYIARGRFEHLMVARTTISDGYRARAHAMVALARSWRPAEVLPGARTWVEAQAAGQDALSGLSGHLAIEPPTRQTATARASLAAGAAGPAPAGHRLRLAVAAAARDGDQDATATLVRQAPAHGVEVAELVAVAEAHWPKPRAAPSRLAGRTALDRSPAAAAASASRPGGTGRTGAPAMTEPRLRAVVSALVGAIAALAFLVSFRAITEFAVQTGAFPARWGGRRRCWSTASPWPPPSRSCARPWPASGPSTPGAWSPAPPWPRPPSTSPTPPTIRPPRRSPASPRWRCCWPWSC